MNSYLYKCELTIHISANSRFRSILKFSHLYITKSVTRQGGSIIINIIQVTVYVYSFTVPALKLMKVKFCLFLASCNHSPLPRLATRCLPVHLCVYAKRTLRPTGARLCVQRRCNVYQATTGLRLKFISLILLVFLMIT